jgi:hypothetical protein
MKMRLLRSVSAIMSRIFRQRTSARLLVRTESEISRYEEANDMAPPSSAELSMKDNPMASMHTDFECSDRAPATYVARLPTKELRSSENVEEVAKTAPL